MLVKISGRGDRLTLHITFSFVDDKSITLAFAFVVLYYAYTFDCSVHFEFAAQVELCRLFGLIVSTLVM